MPPRPKNKAPPRRAYLLYELLEEEGGRDGRSRACANILEVSDLGFDLLAVLWRERHLPQLLARLGPDLTVNIVDQKTCGVFKKDTVDTTVVRTRDLSAVENGVIAATLQQEVRSGKQQLLKSRGRRACRKASSSPSRFTNKNVK